VTRFDLSTAAALALLTETQLRQLQLAGLARHLDYLAAHSPYYRQRFSDLGLHPRQLQTLADLALFPLTGKGDLEQHNPEFLCVAPGEVRDICLTSGTTGPPLALHQTRQDLARLGYNEAQAFRMTGLTADDRVLIGAALDRCFMAGLAYFLGLNQIGATAIRAGAASPQLLAELILQQQPSAIIGVPSLLVKTAEHLAERKFDPAGLGVKRLICIGEPIRLRSWDLNPLGQKLSGYWQSQLFSTYASTELATACCECEQGRGGHVPPELAIVEIISEQGQAVPAGETGEVVVTPLGVTGMPLLRYRTGDVGFLEVTPCVCGRRTPRLGPVLGRKEQMLKVKGTTLFPQVIISALQELPEVSGCYLEVFREHDLSDHIRVTVALTNSSLTVEQLVERIAARARIKVEVVIATLEQVQRQIVQPDKRKPVTFFDRR
jgi:phenylacetate-CoA ligase